MLIVCQNVGQLNVDPTKLIPPLADKTSHRARAFIFTCGELFCHKFSKTDAKIDAVSNCKRPDYVALI
jgi:hypothetical protein